VKQGDEFVTSNNSRELKRRIKATGPKNKKYTEGIYEFRNKKGKVCFLVDYQTKAYGKDNFSLKGQQFNA